jgi:hypothetical protein
MRGWARWPMARAALLVLQRRSCLWQRARCALGLHGLFGVCWEVVFVSVGYLLILVN